MTPAEELRAAATRLRRAAARATPGPWESMDGGDRIVAWKMTPEGFDDDFDYVVDEPVDNAGDATWIALANPLLAEPLAAWLTEFAEWYDASHVSGLSGVVHECGADDCTCFDAALAVARALNGGAS